MKTIVEALQELYIALGGEAVDVAELSKNVDVLNAICVYLGGEDGAITNSDAIENISKVAHGGGGVDGPYVENKGDTLYYHGYTDEDIMLAPAVGAKANVVHVDLSDTQITKIPAEMFKTCENLETVVFPDGLLEIGDSAFNTCPKLDISELPDTVKKIGANAFYTNTTSCVSLSKLPDALESVGTSAFYNCSLMTISELPASLKTISGSAFNGCKGLCITKIPATVEEVASNAFRGCTGIENIEIATPKLNGGTGFDGCTGLKKIWIRSSCVTIYAGSAGKTPFLNCSTALEIYAEPSEKAAGWGNYFNRTGASGSTTVTVTYDQATSPWSE